MVWVVLGKNEKKGFDCNFCTHHLGRFVFIDPSINFSILHTLDFVSGPFFGTKPLHGHDLACSGSSRVNGAKEFDNCQLCHGCNLDVHLVFWDACQGNDLKGCLKKVLGSGKKFASELENGRVHLPVEFVASGAW